MSNIYRKILINKINIVLNNYQKILKIARNSTSKTNLIINLGLAVGKENSDKIKKFIKDTNFDVNIFTENRKLKKSPYQDKSKLENIVKESYTFSDVLRAYNKKRGSGNFVTLHKYIELYNIDVSHFDSNKRFLIPNYKGRKTTLELLVENSKTGTNVIRKRILKENLLEYVCATPNCGNTGSWFGNKIALQLDHINGINNDHRLENLQFLCPNCHCATPTWGNKRGSYIPPNKITTKLSLMLENIKDDFFNNILLNLKNKTEILKYFKVRESADNYNEINRLLALNKKNKNVNLFLMNIEKNENKFTFLNLDEILKKIEKSSIVKVAQELGCSDNGLRKHLIKNGIDVKSLKVKNNGGIAQLGEQ